MENDFLKLKGKQGIASVLCIVISYVVMYGILMMYTSASHSTTGFLIFIVFCMFFTYKSFKGKLAESLSSLSLPLFLLVLIMISGVIGCFTAPYYIGKWIAGKVKKVLLIAFLRKLSIEELNEIGMNLVSLLKYHDDNPGAKSLPAGIKTYGCITWEEAQNLSELVSNVYSEKVYSKI